jgi:hypothetical protein
MNELRLAAHNRVVAATNAVRKAAILIASHRSKKTNGEQVRNLIDVRFILTQLRHEEKSSPLFTDSEQIEGAIQKMEQYIDGLIEE